MVLLAASGCATQTQPGSTTSTGPTQDLGIKRDVAISGFAFNPAETTIPIGATVIWTNMDSAEHTIVSDTGSEISSNPISNGETYAVTFSAVGTYAYHCGLHPSMKGKIIVQ